MLTEHSSVAARDTKIMTLNRYLIPELDVPLLIKVIQNPRRFPDMARKGLERLECVGLLSTEPQGNFSASPRLFPSYFIGPRLDGRPLYFVSGMDCYKFARMNGQIFTVMEHGVYNIPETISPNDWRTIQIKWSSQVAAELVQRAILSEDQ